MSQFITEGDVSQVLRKVSFPIMIGFFFNTMFNVTDTFYTSKLSIAALAGMSVSFPMFFILISIGAGFSSGITALIGNELGQKNLLKSAHIHIQGLMILVMISMLLALISHPLLDFGLKLMGVSGEFYDYAYQYTLLLYIFGFCLLLTQGINAGLNAQGKTGYFRNFLIASFFLNVILDPILIFGLFGFPRMETAGAATATIFVNFIGIFYLGYKLKKTNFWRGITWHHFIPNLRIFIQIMNQGVSSFLNMFMITVFFFFINYFLNLYGMDTVAAFGIGLRMEQLALIPCIGINIATVTIVAQNSGAGKPDRVKATYRYALKLTLMIVATLCFFVFFFRETLMSVFSDDVKVIAIGSSYLVFMTFFTIGNGLINVNHGVLQGLKKPHLPMINGFIRQMIIPGILMYMVAVVFKLPVEWMWVTLLICSLSGYIISQVLVLNFLKKI